ncbi:MAG: dTDP-4-dehydrorhamnose 3,5-epimerase [Nitrospiria bacterium]
MKIIETRLPGVVIIEPKLFHDGRGFFMETWHQGRYTEAGLSMNFVQDNVSFSTKGVLRGLHFQHPNPQGKLVTVLQGEVFDVAVDIRVGSPTFGQWTGTLLSSGNGRQMVIPEGFAHGFCITSQTALFTYKCTAFYAPQSERTLLWNDPDIGIAWPIEAPILSEKDVDAPRLIAIDQDRLPRFTMGS